jgi:hypothetical protein
MILPSIRRRRLENRGGALIAKRARSHRWFGAALTDRRRQCPGFDGKSMPAAGGKVGTAARREVAGGQSSNLKEPENAHHQ